MVAATFMWSIVRREDAETLAAELAPRVECEPQIKSPARLVDLNSLVVEPSREELALVDDERDQVDTLPVFWTPRTISDNGDAKVEIEVVAKEDGSPVKGVALEFSDAPLWENGPHGAEQFRASSQTGDDGRAKVTLPPGRAFLVAARTEREPISTAELTLGPFGVGEVASTTIVLRSRADDRCVVRVIDDASEKPIVGASARPASSQGSMSSQRPSRARTTSLDSDLAHALDSVRTASSDGASAQFALAFASNIDASSDGAAALAPEREAPSAGELESGADGIVEIPFATWKHELFAIDADGYGPALVESTPGHDSVDDAVIVRLSRCATMFARVADLSGAPRQAIRVIVSAQRRALLQGDGNRAAIGGEWSASGSTTTDQIAAIEQIPSKVPYSIQVLRSDVRVLDCPSPITLEPGERRSIELEIAGGTRVVGQIHDSRGEPLDGAEIWIIADSNRSTSCLDSSEVGACASRAWTNAYGAFSFEHIATGDWLVGPAPWVNRDTAPIGRTIRITPGMPTIAVELCAMRGFTIRGHVFDPRGRAASDQRVVASSSKSRARFTVLSDRDGGFVLGPLADEEYEVRAQATKRCAASETVTVRGGDSAIELRLQDAATLAVTVLDASGRSIRNAEVFAMPRQRRAFEPAIGPLQLVEGVYSETPIPIGSYDVVATFKDSIGGARVELSDRSTDPQSIRLQRAARVRPTWFGGTQSATLDLAFADFQRGRIELSRGEPDTVLVFPGSTKFHWIDSRGADGSQSLDLAAGETKSITIGKKD